MNKEQDSVKNEAKALKLRKYADTVPLYALAFLFPTLTVITAFAILQCYPFGGRTMLTVDLYHQYAPYLVAFRNKVLSGDSLFYSWNDGLGNEYFAAYANYTASPLNIFCLFFTAKTMPVFIAFITAIRAGLASLTMTLFLKAHDRGRFDNITVAFAVLYSLCGWFVTDFWNIMWCDALIFLPLICLGLRKLFLENSWWLYMVSLGVAIASNYFTGYFLCLFLVFFAPIYYVMVFVPSKDKTLKNRLCVKTCLLSGLKFGIASVIAGVATAGITLPTYLILQHCSATGNEFPTDYNLTGNLFDFLGRLMVSAAPAIRDGMANVHCGIIVVLMLPLFFILPKESGITLRHKFGFGIILGILYLSFTNRTLNFIWHGLHFPNQIPYRESFLMPFILVMMGFLTIRRLRSLPKGAVGASIGGAFIFLVLYEKFGEGDEGYIQIGLTLLFLIVQGIALKVITDRKRSMLYCEMLLTVTILVESLVGSIVSIALVAKNEGFVNYDFFGKNYQQINEYVELVEGTEGHKSFERSELYPNNICNIQSLYKAKGMSIFSSTTRESFVKYNRNFGLHNNGINGLRNSGMTRLTASLFGARNFIAIEKTNSLPKIFEQEYTDDRIIVYGNPDALALGYMTSRDVVDFEPVWENSDAFSKTNQWLNSMGVKNDCYTPVSLISEDSDNMTTGGNDSYQLLYTVVPNSANPWFTVTIEDADEGADLYVYVNANAGGNATVSCGDEEYSYEIRNYQTICLGKYTGEPVTLTVKYNKNPGNSLKVYGYELKEDNFRQAMDYLSDEQFEVANYDSTHVEGSITANEDGLLFMTIPYSEGWSAKVDGKETDIVPVGDSYIGLDLTCGTHFVELSYRPHGFDEGIVVSVIAIVVMAGVSTVFELKRRKASKNETAC